MECIVDYWENQRYKPMQGGWTTPYTTGVPSFSDLSYQNTCHEDQIADVDWNAGAGWEWTQKAFEVDMSGEYGKVDEDGWSYATNFEKLMEMTRTKTLSGEKAVMHMARRRRWTRTRVVKSEYMKEKVHSRVRWVSSVSFKMQEVISENKAAFARIEQYNTQREEAIEKIISVTDASFVDILAILNTLNVKLTMMNTFLRERGDIEQAYSAKMEALASKWMNAGATPSQYASTSGGAAAASSAQPAAEAAGGSAPKAAAGTASTAPPVPTGGGGFFHIVSTAHRSIAERLVEFSDLLKVGLPKDVDAILEDVGDALVESTTERAKLKQRVGQRLAAAEKMLENYRQCIVYSSKNINRDGEKMLSEMNCISASSIHLSASTTHPERRGSLIIAAAPAGPTAAALTGAPSLEKLALTSHNMILSEKGECFNNLHQIDVWLALRVFYGELIEVDSAVLLYNAFSKQLRKKTENFAQSVAKLLKSTVKVFAHEQFRVWEDNAQMLDAVGMSSNTVLVRQPAVGGAAAGGSAVVSPSNSPGGKDNDDEQEEGEEDSEDEEEDEEEEENEDVAMARYIDILVRKNSYFPMMPTGDNAGLSHHSHPATATAASSSSSSGRKRLQSIHHAEHGFALCGQLKVLLVHTTDSVSSFASSTSSSSSSSGAQSASGAKAEIIPEAFTDVLAAVTFDKVLHIFRISPEYDGEANHGGLSHDGTYHSGFEKKHLVVSVPLEEAEVGPIFIPKDGFRDAFEVFFPKSGANKIMAPVLLTSSSSSNSNSAAAARQNSSGSADETASNTSSGSSGSSAAQVAVASSSSSSPSPASPSPMVRRASIMDDFSKASGELFGSITAKATSMGTPGGSGGGGGKTQQRPSIAVQLKPLAAVVMVASSSAKVLEWMRIIAKPFCDARDEEPISPEEEDRDHIGDMADLYEGQDDHAAMCIPVSSPASDSTAPSSGAAVAAASSSSSSSRSLSPAPSATAAAAAAAADTSLYSSPSGSGKDDGTFSGSSPISRGALLRSMSPMRANNSSSSSSAKRASLLDADLATL